MIKISAEAQRASNAAKKNLNRAKCEQYTAKVKEQEYKVRGRYKTRADKLSNESYLGTLKSLKARYCQ
jgi:hypothetical protein